MFKKRSTEKSRTSRKQKSQPPLTPGGREKVTQINVCIANKQMHDKDQDQVPLPQGQKKHIDKEQGKTKHEEPCSVNYRATQNKTNIGTTALEQSVVYITGGGGGGGG